MGTDIHVFIEREYNGRWVPVHPPEVKDPKDWEAFGRYAHPIPPMEQLAQAVLPFEERIPTRAAQWWVCRDYTLFTNLASVRNYENCSVFDEPRGLPDDVSEAVSDSICDRHSKSFWALGELQMAWDEAENPEGVSERVSMLIDAMRQIATEYNLADDQVRMVFGFDS